MEVQNTLNTLKKRSLTSQDTKPIWEANLPATVVPSQFVGTRHKYSIVISFLLNEIHFHNSADAAVCQKL